MIHLARYGNVPAPVDYIQDSLANRRTQKPALELVQKLHATHALTLTAPAKYSLASFEGPTLDQGPYGACTGAGSAQALYTTLAARGKPLGFFPSPREIYTVNRCLERSSSSEPLTDSGAMPTDIITTCTSFGVVKMGPMANDGRNFDVDDTNINAEPDLVQLEESALNLEIGAYRIDETDPSAIDLICGCIVQGVTVGIGFFCDAAFQAYDGGAPVDVVNLNDPNGGGHWVFIDEYSTDSKGNRVLTGVNSWSSTWGANGRFSVTEKWFHKAVSDILPFAVGV